MGILKFAGIDIGTNAARLFVANIIENSNDYSKFAIIKSSLVRVPIRLGEDAFTIGELTGSSIKKLTLVMESFKRIIEVSDVIKYRACATSALREVTNGEQVTDQIRLHTNINIEIISGEEEAKLLYFANIKFVLKPQKHYLSVDLGGGSLEFTLFDHKQIKLSKSFKVGTIRALCNKIDPFEWDHLKEWSAQLAYLYKPLELIGSGGNINKIAKLLGYDQSKPITEKSLTKFYDSISKLSYEDRMITYQLSPDRADVIVPATETFLKIMQYTGIKEIKVPVFGLADGIVVSEYRKFRQLTI